MIVRTVIGLRALTSVIDLLLMLYYNSTIDRAYYATTHKRQ